VQCGRCLKRCHEHHRVTSGQSAEKLIFRRHIKEIFAISYRFVSERRRKCCWTRRRGSISVDSISSVAANIESSYQDHKELIFYQTNHRTFVQFFTLSFDSTSQFAFSAWVQWSKEKNFLLNEKYRIFELLCWKNKASIFVHTSVTLGSETKLKLIKMERHTRDVRDEVRDSFTTKHQYDSVCDGFRDDVRNSIRERSDWLHQWII